MLLLVSLRRRRRRRRKRNRRGSGGEWAQGPREAAQEQPDAGQVDMRGGEAEVARKQDGHEALRGRIEQTSELNERREAKHEDRVLRI